MDHEEPLVRRLTAVGIWMLAVNGMIGAGIFGVPAGAAALAGAWSPLVFVACGLLLGAVILCFAELAGHFRSTGGPILYARTAFGPFAGFQTGWAFYIARVTAFAANINLLVASIGFFWPNAAQGIGRVVLLTIVVALLTWVNVVGIRQAVRAIGVLTVLKFLPLVLLVVIGLTALTPGAFGVGMTAPTALGFGQAALLVVYAFVGWESAVVPAGETRDPARDIPRGLLWALGVVTVLYVLVQAVSMAVHPDLAGSTSGRALIEVGAELLGPVGALILTIGVVVSVAGNSASSMLTSPRMTYTLARDNTMPVWFARVHEDYKTPANSIIFFGALALVLALWGSFVWLAAMSALVRVLIYMVCIGAMPRLRARFGSESNYRVPGGWAIPVLAFAVCGLLLTQVNVASVGLTVAFAALGAIQYWFVRSRRYV
ncbi:MAG: APC family permease [Gammaproteobacteria bacterium]